MTPTRKGAFRIFAFAGIGVYVHWSWFLVAVYSVQFRTNEYSSAIWNVLEYLTLFLIVLIHEFGHQLACRQVGGQTHDIVLWPLGGVAYVTPPQRPGAQLWSIAAGPLVNVALAPVLVALAIFADRWGWSTTHADASVFVTTVMYMNFGLLCFNLLPVYPLDGGQILRSLLWFLFGRARSLLFASGVGFIGVAGLAVLALWWQSIWIGIMAFFILINCWRGLTHARALAQLARLPRRAGFACPSCQVSPPIGERWRCGNCGNGFDMFLSDAICPHCGAQYHSTPCLDCGTANPISEWMTNHPNKY